MNFLKDLNQVQQDAVQNVTGPMMIIAGAGSGKTRVLTYRIAQLIEQGIEPFNILALTFTNKAAKEMQERIERLVGHDARNLWMGTFHSVFAKILRFEADKLGYNSQFTIYDTTDSVSLVKSIIKEMQLDDEIYKAKAIFHRISWAKNHLIGWQSYSRHEIFQAEDIEAHRPLTARIFQKYTERCFKSNAMDFDDLLYNTNLLFKKNLDVLNKYQHRFKFVLLDEFQDTNISQYLITKQLAAVHQNICVVGDDAQSIYAFRGANIENILNFEKDYPDLRVFKLEQNYRSTQHIVEAANQVILNNRNQLKKTVWTDNETGVPIQVIKAASDNDEGRLVAHAIFEEKMQKGLKNSDFAILYRTNYQSRAFEEALRKINIKYKVIGGLSFYQRKEIKDLIAYLRFSLNQADEEAFKRIVNYPKRGIGDTSISKLIVAADENSIPLWDVLQNASRVLGNRGGGAVENFVALIKDFALQIRKRDAYEAASYIVKQSGLLKDLFEDKTVEGRARYENVQELLNAIKNFTDQNDEENRSLANFLEEVSLLTSADDQKDQHIDSVTLMTIHAAKGLEFKNIFIVGLEEDLFPSQMMLQSREDLEEERRLFYVAITRAEKKLTLSYALQRYRFGHLKPCEPSRFLSEINPKYLQMVNFRQTNFQPQSFAPKVIIPKTNSSPAPKKLPDIATDIKFVASDPKKLAVGLAVFHAKFGKGTVLGIEISGIERRVKVEFEEVGEKTLLMSFAKLMILE